MRIVHGAGMDYGLLKHSEHGSKQDCQVRRKRPFPLVFKREGELRWKNFIDVLLLQAVGRQNSIFVSEGKACGIGNARAVLQDDRVLWSEHLYVAIDLGPRANQLHIAFQHIEQLRKFVEFVSPE